jgi:signal peptidase II
MTRQQQKNSLAEPFTSKPLWPVWFALAALAAALDQIGKVIVGNALPLQASVEVTPWFNLVHVLNPGAAFSFLADAEGWQRHFLTAIGVVVSAALLFWLWKGVKSRLETAAFISIIGGALGNVIDRVRLGAVVDYLDLYWRNWHWPAFNLADIFVVGGAGLLLLASFLEPSHRKATLPSSSA